MENKIVQLKDERGNNIYPLGYIGSNLELLWTNASPTSTFNAQKVEVDLREFSTVLVVIKATNGATAVGSCTTLIKGLPSQRVYNCSDAIYYRNTPLVEDSGITFEGGYKGSTSGNTNAIPYQIYGIK